MKKKFVPLALFVIAVSGIAMKAHAQTEIDKPQYFRLDITLSGKASCFWDGSDCKVG